MIRPQLAIALLILSASVEWSYGFAGILGDTQGAEAEDAQPEDADGFGDFGDFGDLPSFGDKPHHKKRKGKDEFNFDPSALLPDASDVATNVISGLVGGGGGEDAGDTGETGEGATEESSEGSGLGGLTDTGSVAGTVLGIVQDVIAGAGSGTDAASTTTTVATTTTEGGGRRMTRRLVRGAKK